MTTVDTQPQQPARTDEELKAQQRAALRKAALEYHEFPTPGKISVTPTKPLSNQRDLGDDVRCKVPQTGSHHHRKYRMCD